MSEELEDRRIQDLAVCRDSGRAVRIVPCGLKTGGGRAFSHDEQPHYAAALALGGDQCGVAPDPGICERKRLAAAQGVVIQTRAIAIPKIQVTATTQRSTELCGQATRGVPNSPSARIRAGSQSSGGAIITKEGEWFSISRGAADEAQSVLNYQTTVANTS